MNPTRIDQLSRIFAARRHSHGRVASTEVASLGTASTQESASLASQSPGPDGPAASMFLFLQSFQSGSLTAKGDDTRSFTLTLEHGLGQTIYFSDRPERVVGAAPTAQFLAGFGFSPESPPNAALLVEDEQGTSIISVVELTNPSYDEASRTATYDATELAEFSGGAGLAFRQESAGMSSLPSTFAAAHLFIDDCSGEVVACYPAGQSGSFESYLGFVKASGMCWDPVKLTCTECNPAPDVLACQAKYPDVCTDASPCEAVQITPP